MKFIGKIILFIVVNALALLIAARFVKDFIFEGNLTALLTAAVILTLGNTFIRPLLKFVLAPLINLTFGVLAIAINASFIYLLDKFSPSLIINGLKPLILATVIISLVNIVANFLTKLGD
ncbi:MAG: phage holin family protein [Patescibacteria group bacterium]